MRTRAGGEQNGGADRFEEVKLVATLCAQKVNESDGEVKITTDAESPLGVEEGDG
jgi:hypothetical protein